MKDILHKAGFAPMRLGPRTVDLLEEILMKEFPKGSKVVAKTALCLEVLVPEFPPPLSRELRRLFEPDGKVTVVWSLFPGACFPVNLTLRGKHEDTV